MSKQEVAVPPPSRPPSRSPSTPPRSRSRPEGDARGRLLTGGRVTTGVAIACIPRLVTLLPGPVWGGASTWADTVVWLPGDLSRFTLVHAFTGQAIHLGATTGLRVAELFAHFPVALLTGQGAGPGIREQGSGIRG